MSCIFSVPYSKLIVSMLMKCVIIATVGEPRKNPIIEESISYAIGQKRPWHRTAAFCS